MDKGLPAVEAVLQLADMYDMAALTKHLDVHLADKVLDVRRGGFLTQCFDAHSLGFVIR